MKLEKLLENKSNEIIKIDSAKTVYEAIHLLNKHKIGALLVMSVNKTLEGIITERDILFKCLESEKDNHETKISEVMTPKEKLIIGTIEDTLSYAMRVMVNKKIRHLPIVDNKNVIGMISIGDLIKEILEQSETEVKLLREYVKNPYGINL